MVPTISSLLSPVCSSRLFQLQGGFSSVCQPWRPIHLSFHLQSALSQRQRERERELDKKTSSFQTKYFHAFVCIIQQTALCTIFHIKNRDDLCVLYMRLKSFNIFSDLDCMYILLMVLFQIKSCLLPIKPTEYSKVFKNQASKQLLFN